MRKVLSAIYLDRDRHARLWHISLLICAWILTTPILSYAQEETPVMPASEATAEASEEIASDADEILVQAGFVCDTSPDAFIYHIEQGGLLRGRGNPDEALRHYTCAIERNPEAYLPYRSRAIVRTAIGQFQSALADIDRSLELNPDDPIAYNNRANTLIRIGRYGEAIVALNRAILLDPENATAYNNRGLVYSKLGDNDNAIADYERAIELGHTPVYFPYVNLGNLYKEQGQYREALIQFDRAIIQDPFYADGYKLVGDMHLQLGNIDQAETNYLRYVDIMNDASEEVLGYIEVAQIRELVQRYLPSILVIVIILYFIVDAFLRWRRSRTKMIAPPAIEGAQTAMQNDSGSSALSTPPSPSLASNKPPANRSWRALLIVPIIASIAVFLRGFGRDE